MSDSAHHLRSMDHAVEHGTGHTAHLDALEESVNRQIDADIRVLLDNFREMIHLSRIGEKDHFDVSRDSFILETRADSMVRAAQSLYLLSDSLKLSLLLSQSQMSEARDQETKYLLDQTKAHMHSCSELLSQHWLSGAISQSGPDPVQSGQAVTLDTS
ncbi:Surfeit locus protein 5 subunit 22 of Mediator complex [Malassezia restricta CBS 7877]|uniref:Surfeit locus protein 5 subunit 22 of Mediator complex n=1 Tax=Malassezia restricta (strain ATCC 96810 / NBRC 103918 / CBS 7877) TaxID=425264 RepID=A0A3G2S2M5_MALR7|nr:Surfeit locus protein 5 subunit 22 of Mediator complex [Malassezia restricta CBS 7877]